jgi:hypothetical protein
LDIWLGNDNEVFIRVYNGIWKFKEGQPEGKIFGGECEGSKEKM